MTCEDLAEASAEADLVEVEIKRKARVDVDAITGVLIDGGIRNALAHDESKKELKRRRSSIDLSDCAAMRLRCASSASPSIRARRSASS